MSLKRGEKTHTFQNERIIIQNCHSNEANNSIGMETGRNISQTHHEHPWSWSWEKALMVDKRMKLNGNAILLIIFSYFKFNYANYVWSLPFYTCKWKLENFLVYIHFLFLVLWNEFIFHFFPSILAPSFCPPLLTASSPRQSFLGQHLPTRLSQRLLLKTKFELKMKFMQKWMHQEMSARGMEGGGGG